MRTDFSPMAEAARRLSAGPVSSKSNSGSTPPIEPRWCEWPRRAPAKTPRGGIWHALQQIQARHA